jgi:hypothetical protein
VPGTLLSLVGIWSVLIVLLAWFLGKWLWPTSSCCFRCRLAQANYCILHYCIESIVAPVLACRTIALPLLCVIALSLCRRLISGRPASLTRISDVYWNTRGKNNNCYSQPVACTLHTELYILNWTEYLRELHLRIVRLSALARVGTASVYLRKQVISRSPRVTG